jgi:hypothetical protein
MFKKMLFAAVVGLLTFTSCKKDPLDTTLLTTGKWKVTADTRNGVDQFITSKNCEKDNTWTFETLGFLTIDEGATKCSASDPQTYTAGRWSLSGTEQKKLIITEDKSNGYIETLDIIELTSTVLKITATTAGSTVVITLGKG